MPTDARLARVDGIEICVETHRDPSGERLPLVMGATSLASRVALP